VFVLIAMMPGILLLLLRNKRFAENKRLQSWSDFSSWLSLNIILPLVGRPLNYLNLTFTSNVSRRRMYTVIILVIVLMFSGVITLLLHTMLDLSGRTGFAFHSFFAQDAGVNLLDARRYDNLRPEGQALPKVSISADMVSEPFLRVFVTYPKSLDARLSQYCTAVVLPDSLPKQMRRHLTDSTHLECFSRFFQISVNDSTYTPAEWIFHQHPIQNTRGLLTYLPTGQFRQGKNVLMIQVPSEKNADSLRTYGVVPFWYAPK
jgi:hypothetical protein